MSVRIIADSACDLPSSFHPALTVLPLTVAFGSDIYRDGVDITTDRFYEMLVEGDVLPTTSQVTPYEFGEAFRDAVEAGDEVVAVTVSGDLSGTYASALAAAEGMDTVHVVDSRNVTVGEHILVRYALSLVDEGLDAAQIAARLTERRDDIRVVALLDTLEYLRRGGRVPAAVGVIGEMLAIKPVVAVRAGPRTAATCSRRRSTSAVPWTSACRSASATPACPTACCASTSRTSASCGRARSTPSRFPCATWAPRSARMWVPAPSPRRFSPAPHARTNDVKRPPARALLC